MPIETAEYINDLNVSYPPDTDPQGEAASHLRIIKAALKATFPNIDGPVTADQAALSSLFEMPVGSVVSFFGAEEDIATGWALCDGRTVARTDGTGNITTPDLRGRFLLGVSDTYALSATGGAAEANVNTGDGGAHSHGVTVDAGGAHSHTGSVSGHALTTAELPAHSHLNVVSGIGNDTLTGSNSLSQERTAGGDTEYILNSAAGTPTLGKTSEVGSGQAHTHGLTVNSGGSHSHTAETDEEADHNHSVTVPTLPPYVACNFIMKV
ncbi:hypothetical protein BSL82_03730 [Tardibacter chloracetimidivorans]|uniref:Uncharacterized protein n=1 Tax=Tardibacter chloracetimidivorans TaxID=1921510 RepID=A0A1L3ZSC5_9SPHN|nr:tail fiber protein [Tardibacter chloracetimidivorans]API58527.1 hypothetical protein BSL82_03730 [Tardibacter chloracetimidivorans]